eukprot:scpid98868/ scgid25046/ 
MSKNLKQSSQRLAAATGQGGKGLPPLAGASKRNDNSARYPTDLPVQPATAYHGGNLPGFKRETAHHLPLQSPAQTPSSSHRAQDRPRYLPSESLASPQWPGPQDSTHSNYTSLPAITRPASQQQQHHQHLSLPAPAASPASPPQPPPP